MKVKKLPACEKKPFDMTFYDIEEPMFVTYGEISFRMTPEIMHKLEQAYNGNTNIRVGDTLFKTPRYDQIYNLQKSDTKSVTLKLEILND